MHLPCKAFYPAYLHCINITVACYNYVSLNNDILIQLDNLLKLTWNEREGKVCRMYLTPDQIQSREYMGLRSAPLKNLNCVHLKSLLHCVFSWFRRHKWICRLKWILSPLKWLEGWKGYLVYHLWEFLASIQMSFGWHSEDFCSSVSLENWGSWHAVLGLSLDDLIRVKWNFKYEIVSEVTWLNFLYIFLKNLQWMLYFLAEKAELLCLLQKRVYEMFHSAHF